MVGRRNHQRGQPSAVATPEDVGAWRRDGSREGHRAERRAVSTESHACAHEDFAKAVAEPELADFNEGHARAADGPARGQPYFQPSQPLDRITRGDHVRYDGLELGR